MVKNKIFLFLFSLGLLLPTFSLRAQTNVNSPYSRYGYGILDNRGIGASRAMDGLGYAVQSGKQINVKNPASYAAIDTLTFLCDFGVSLLSNTMKEGAAKENRVSWSFDYIALQFPLAKWLAVSLGVVPYSTVGYDYAGSIKNGSVRQTGEGSLNEAFIGFGAYIYKGFSLGFNVDYLFGELNNNSVSVSSLDAMNATLFENVLNVSDFRIEIGAQYTCRLNAKNRFTLGVLYTPAKKLLGKGYVRGGAYNVSSGNTVAFQNDTVKLKDGYSLPATYGAGFTYTPDDRLTAGIDVTFQPWSKAKYAGSTAYFNNYLQVIVGAEFMPKLYSSSFFQSVRYRAGVNVCRSYARIKTSDNTYNDLWETGFTVGMGLPMKRNKSIINIAFGYQNRRTTPLSSVTENEFRVSIGLTFNEMWFYKNRLQ